MAAGDAAEEAWVELLLELAEREVDGGLGVVGEVEASDAVSLHPSTSPKVGGLYDKKVLENGLF